MVGFMEIENGNKNPQSDFFGGYVESMGERVGYPDLGSTSGR
jgi:hypothetical protein